VRSDRGRRPDECLGGLSPERFRLPRIGDVGPVIKDGLSPGARAFAVIVHVEPVDAAFVCDDLPVLLIAAVGKKIDVHRCCRVESLTCKELSQPPLKI
jgi:hypothetical protein